MRYDWTKLTNGWVRHGDEVGIAGIYKGGVDVCDDGEVFIEPDTRDAGYTPEHTFKLLAEAVAQRKQCTVDDRAERAAKALRGYFDIFTVTTNSTEVTISTHCNFRPVPRVILSRRCIRVEEPIHLSPDQGEAIAKAIRILQEEP